MGRSLILGAGKRQWEILRRVVSSSVLWSHSKTLFVVLTPCKSRTPESGFSYATSASFLSLWPALQFISVDPVSQCTS